MEGEGTLPVANGMVPDKHDSATTQYQQLPARLVFRKIHVASEKVFNDFTEGTVVLVEELHDFVQVYRRKAFPFL